MVSITHYKSSWTYIYRIVRNIKYTILYIINYIMYIEQKLNIDPHLYILSLFFKQHKKTS